MSKWFYWSILSNRFVYLRPPPQKMSIFVKNFEIEINAWEDSPSSALSETTLVFLRYLVFGQNFRWFSLTSSWKICLFLKKRKMFFVFSRFMIFWSSDKEFLEDLQSIYRVVHKLPATLLLGITFDWNKIQTCGFRHSKERCSDHRSI